MNAEALMHKRRKCKGNKKFGKVTRGPHKGAYRCSRKTKKK